MSTDLTVVVTVHDQTAVCGPTMDAVDLAVGAVRARGRTVQPVIALAAATEVTGRYVDQPCFDHWERRRLPSRDPGRVRNAIAEQSEGRHLAFVEAGDLISENWLEESLAVLDAAAGRGERVIAHPELDVVFDGRTEVRRSVAQDHRLFTPHHLYAEGYYPSSCVAPRAAHLEVPYTPQEDVDRSDGDAGSCRELQWSIETMAAGWRHVVVPDTILFRRHRDLFATATRPERPSLPGALPAMAIDRVRDLGRVHPA